MLRLFVILIAWACIRVDAQVSNQTPYNGSLARPYNVALSPFNGKTFTVALPPTGMAFTFTFKTPQRQTSAVVYNSSGIMVRTLWTSRSYLAGTWGDIWDGLDDYGIQVPAGTYTIHMTANNIQYIPYGVIGDINAHEYSPNSWNLGFESFQVDMASIQNTAFTAQGYTEGAFSCATFQLDSPIDNIQPCETQSFGGDIFTYVATDGHLFYFVDRGFTSATDGENGIVAIDPQGNLHNFPEGRFFRNNYTTTANHTGHFINSLDGHNVRYWDAEVADFGDLHAAAPSIPTGIAVERNGSVMAVAHGSFGAPTTSPLKNTNTVRLFDKWTGRSLKTITIPKCDPHRMTFDLSNNLWVICGDGGLVRGGVQVNPNDTLIEIEGIGPTDSSAETWNGSIALSPIEALSNPMAIAISPITGNLFVADGGKNQQVYEYSPSLTLLRTLGVAGGYRAGSGCDAKITNYKFWFDQGQTGATIPTGLGGSMFANFVWPDDRGGLWVSDIGTYRVLHYVLVGGKWNYENRQMYQPFEVNNVMATNDPRRILGGQSGVGLIEFDIDYARKPMEGDPDPTLGGTGWWEEKYNWLACIVSHPNYAANGSSGFPRVIDFWVNPMNDTTLIAFQDSKNILQRAIANANGTVNVLSNADIVGTRYNPHSYLSPDGEQWLMTAGGAGGSHVGADRYPVKAFDSYNLPILGTRVHQDGPIVNNALGQPVLTPSLFNGAPSSGGIFTVLQGSANTVAPSSSPKFHLGGFVAGASMFTWLALPEKDISEADGEMSFPALNIGSVAYGGTEVFSLNHDIFAEFNGNGFAWGCQFWHYSDDGTALGQFGYLPSIAPVTTFQEGSQQNVPLGAVGRWKVPGFCGDQGLFKVAQVGLDYFTYIGDESYIHGIHLWKIANLGSLSKTSGVGKLGSTLILR